METGCDPDAIPMYYDSLEDCVMGCIETHEQYFADGCGPEELMQIICWADLSCEQWLEFTKTGYSDCGDTPETVYCDD